MLGHDSRKPTKFIEIRLTGAGCVHTAQQSSELAQMLSEATCGGSSGPRKLGNMVRSLKPHTLQLGVSGCFQNSNGADGFIGMSAAEKSGNSATRSSVHTGGCHVDSVKSGIEGKDGKLVLAMVACCDIFLRLPRVAGTTTLLSKGCCCGGVVA